MALIGSKTDQHYYTHLEGDGNRMRPLFGNRDGGKVGLLGYKSNPPDRLDMVRPFRNVRNARSEEGPRRKSRPV